jgi:hypothetical protein
MAPPNFPFSDRHFGSVSNDFSTTLEIMWKEMAVASFRILSRVSISPDFFRTVLILSFLYEIKRTLIPDGEKSGNPTICGIFNIAHYNFMQYTTFKYKAIVVSSLLLCTLK